ncbi:MAG: response regulator, partial [Ignavibacteria bacterium]|nr:response regulator [Ignavibacteria bacterium]
MKNKVAIIEDESIVALDMSTSLKAGGYEVTFITDQGEKALELIESSKPDIVIIDIELKGEMNGVETAKVIRDRYN